MVDLDGEIRCLGDGASKVHEISALGVRLPFRSDLEVFVLLFSGWHAHYFSFLRHGQANLL